MCKFIIAFVYKQETNVLLQNSAYLPSVLDKRHKDFSFESQNHILHVFNLEVE